MRDVEQLFARLERSTFRRRFRLNRSEKEYVARKTLPVVLQHARQFVQQRLAAADPPNDGRQTPMRGHPVFVAQHATATCCRSCLTKWHGLAKGLPLREADVDYVLEVIRHWLQRQQDTMPASSAPAQRQLFEF